MRKLSKSGIFIFMTVIILLQYVSPILAVANTLDEKNDLVSLKTAKVSKEDDQTVTVNLKVTANNTTEQAVKTKIEFSNKAIVFKEALNQLTTSKNQYKLNGLVLEATIAPNTSKEENDLIIKLDKASLKGIDTVEVISGDSKTTLDLSGVTQLPEKSATTPESASKTPESSTPASSTTNSSTKEEANKAEVVDKKATAKLSSANLKSFDSSLISKVNVTDVVQFTTETHMGRISINANKETVPTALENAYIEIVIPTEDVEAFEVPPAGIIKNTIKTVNPDGTTTIRLDLNKIDSTTTASFPFTVKFKNRVTPNGYNIEPKITLYSGDTDNPDSVAASGDLKMETKTFQPSIKKYVFSNSNDAYSQDNIDVYGGVSNEPSGEHITSNAQDITFQYAMSTWQSGGANANDIARQRSREYDNIVLTDTLPSYTDISGNVRTAKFDPSKNPGWVLSSDGKTVTKTVTASQFDAYNDAARLVSNEKLVLSFEGAPFGEKVNTIKADVSIKDKSSYETNPTVSDDIKFNLTKDVRLPDGMFDKRLVTNRNVMLEAGQNHLLTSYFSLYVTNKTSLPMSNIVISDTKFDNEFYMQRLAGDSSRIKAVYGIKDDGTKELITSPFDNIDSQTSAAIANQVDQVTNHGANPSDQPKVDPAYKSLEIQLKDDYKLMPGEALTYYVLMGLNNPYNVEKDIKPSKQAYNEAKLNFALNYSDGSQKTYDVGPVSDYVVLVPKTEQITMGKWVHDNYQGTVGEKLTYQIFVDLSQLFKTRIIKNARIVDLLPAGVTFVSTGDGKDSYTIVDNYLNSGRQAIIFNLGDLDMSKMSGAYVNKYIYVTINDKAVPSNRTTEDKNNKNYSYFIGDNLDALVKDNNIKTYYTLKDFFDVNGNGDKQEKIIGAERDIIVNLPSEIRSLKWIRKEGQTAWIPTGIDIPYNQNFEYNLSTENYGDSLISKLTIYDRLPYNGDKNASQFENTLRSAITVPDGFTAYYRTDSATGTPEEEAKSDKWVTSVDDYSKVTAIKVVMKDGTTVPSGSSIDIIVPMTSPKKVNDDLNSKSAINSFYTSRDGEQSFGVTNKVYDRLPQTLKVKKTWVNGKLDKIGVQVYRESNKDFVVRSADLTKDNDYSYEFNDLPGVDEKGNLISDYKVREVINSSNVSSEDYDTDISGDQLNGFVITNKLKSTSLSGEKVWKDADNQDGLRPNNITINLLADGKKIDKQIISDKENWKFNFTDLQKSINGKDIVYSISEESVDKYTSSIDDTNKDKIIITNTYTPDLVDVKGTKTWDDKDNQDGLRPDKIIVNLMDGEVKVASKEVTSASDWTYSFTSLPKFKAGKAIVYTVSEEKVTGYDATTKGFDLTNTHTPELTEVSGTKTWSDKDNQDGLRPEKITVNLKVGDKVISTQEVTAKDDWKYSFDKLPKFEAGKAIEYTISEEKVTGYDTAINGTDLTNTHTPELTEVKGTKTWDDRDNQDGLRPDKIIVNLMDGEVKVASKEVTSASDWTYSFTSLPKFKAGKAIVYTVSEEKVTGYDATTKGFDLTNTHTPELTEVSGTKTWSDKDNQDGLRPEKITVNLKVGDKVISTQEVTAKDDWKYSFDKLPKFEAGKAIEYTISEEKVTGYDTAINGTDLTNTHTPELTEVKGTKTWDDRDNQDGLRPDKIIVNLMDGEVKVASKEVTSASDWTYSFTSLPKFKAGKAIVYTVSEEKVTGYDATTKGFDLTNTHTPELTEVSGTKTWSDKDNQDGLRPEKITVNLKVGDKVISTQEVTAKDDWKYSFDKLPKFEAGKAIEYTISEEKVTGYDTAINGTDLTNTHTPELTEVSGTKTWSDKDNQDGLRPEKITVNLKVGDKVISTQEVTAKDDWKYSFDKLPKFEAGKAIEYTISEEKVTGYDTAINGTDLTNTHTPELTEVKGTKTWDDRDNQDGLRPDKIIVNLMDGEVKVASKEVTSASDWTYSFTSLPKFKAGKAIVYTVSEEKVTGYDATTKGFDLTNTHTPELTEVSGTKTWSDKDNQDGLRPEKITVNLKVGDKVISTQEVTAKDDWKYSFDKLPKFEAGKAIEYTISEEKVTGYDTAINGTDLTNTHTPELTEVKGTKTWDDRDNQDGLRPDKIIVNLMDGEVKVASKEVTSASDWTYSFTSLPKFKAGKAIVYTVSEEKVTGYDATTKGFDLTNTHTPELTEVSGTKTWSDKDNQDGLRPEKITVNLKVGDKVISTQEVTAKDDWKYSFDKLPKFEAGKAIEYTISEEKVTGYDTAINGTDLTNTHTPELTEVKGTKTWDDRDNQDGLRPDKIIVNLMDGEVKVASKEVTSESNWTYSFTDLPKFKAGKAIDYTVTENSMDNYKAKITGFDITNSYTPGKTSVTVTKVWDDSNDQDGLRPKNIKVQLYANDKPSGDPITLDSDNKWMTTFTDLDLKAKGQLIDYKVKEVDNVSGYQTTIDDSNKGNILITNSHKPNLTTFNGTKTWSDSDNQDGLRPTSITVNLLADGKKVGQQVVTADTKWTYSFTGFPQFSAGKPIKYTVSEESVVGYDTTINGYDITNSHTPELIEVNGTKAWNDNNNQDGIRPTSIKVNLLANGKIISFKEVKSTDNWQYKFISLPKFEAGKAIVYTVSEEKVTGYDVAVNGVNLTNTHAPELTAVNGTKTWSDNDNQDGIRPDKITVNLLADGKQVATKEVTAKDNWKYSFANLPKFAAGKAIVYTISEVTVAGYDVTVNGTDLTNTHAPELTAVNGTKTWSDNDNQDGIRPDKITVNLLADGKQVATKEVTAKDNWKYSFANLPKFAAGKAIVYTVSEATVAGYDVTVNGYDLTNTHTPAKPNKPVTPTTPTTPTTPNKPKGSNLPKTSEMINSLYNLIGFVMLALAGFGLVLAKKGKL